MGLWHLNLAINPVQTFLERWFQNLADHYPTLSWMVAHPIVAVISLLVVLAIVQILLGWISGGIKHLLFSIAKSPYSLVRWLLGKTTAPLSNTTTKFQKASKSKIPDQVTTIIKRLNHHQQEQERLLQELNTLLIHKFPEQLPVTEAADSQKTSSDSTTTNTPS